MIRRQICKSCQNLKILAQITDNNGQKLSLYYCSLKNLSELYTNPLLPGFEAPVACPYLLEHTLE